MKLINFNISEFDSPDLEGSGEEMKANFLTKLQTARTLAGYPFSINSGYRTEAHNKRVGGSRNSSHLKGLACDISCKNSNERSLILVSLLAAGFTRIGIGTNFIHVDLDLSKSQNVIWTY